jgi:hypothetical protein
MRKQPAPTLAARLDAFFTNFFMPLLHRARVDPASPSLPAPPRPRFTVSIAGGRGSHSFTFQLNLSAICGIGGAFEDCSGGGKQV